MRRLLILLLVLVVPLKALASVALPFAASMEHTRSLTVHHAGHMGHANAVPAGDAAESYCGGDHTADPHSNNCPHLTMPLLLTAPPARATASGAVGPTAAAAQRLRSVVLDVLLPPPLLLR